MKLFYFVLNQCHYRTGVIMGKTVGVIQADSEDEAIEKINAKYIGVYNTLSEICEFKPSEGFTYTVYKN